MLDIKFIRENKKKVKEGVKNKNGDPKLVDKVLVLYDQWSRKLQTSEKLRQERNEIAKEGKFSEKGKKLKEEVSRVEAENNKAWEDYKRVAEQIPNMTVGGVPVGDESCSRVLKKVGKPPEFNFPVKDHVELGELLGVIDIPRAAKVSGSRFAYLKNEGALLEFALVQMAFQALMKEGFTPVLPPMLIKKEITEGLGYWHGGGNENYYFVKDYEKLSEGKERDLDLYLVGTGEHSGVPMHSREVFEGKDLPQKYVLFSSCFRREAGSYGKDTKGILRVHQFDKVEMVVYVKPKDDEKVRRELLSLVEGLMQSLELPYQTVKLASGDLGFPTAETIDIETWIPSQKKYRETHSISTTTDFQARRLSIKYKEGGEKEFVHVLNGTAFAIGRMIIAILENNQQKDGSVSIPKALQKYTGFEKISPKG